MEFNEQSDREEIYSKPVRAGKRTYFFDVKSTKGEDLYLTITESKKRFRDDGTFFYEKHKIFLYKEDFEKFSDGLKDAVGYIMSHNKSSLETAGSSLEGTAVVAAAAVIPIDGMAVDSWTNIQFEDLGTSVDGGRDSSRDAL